MTADELKAWRVGANLTQDQAAVSLKIGRRALANFEAGKRPVPDKVAAGVATIRAALDGALPLPEAKPGKPRKAKAAAAVPAKPEGAPLHYGNMAPPSPTLQAFMRPLGWEITAVETFPPASGHGSSSMRLHGRKLPNWKPPAAKVGPGDFEPYRTRIRRVRYSKTGVQASS